MIVDFLRPYTIHVVILQFSSKSPLIHGVQHFHINYKKYCRNKFYLFYIDRNWLTSRGVLTNEKKRKND